VLRILLMSDAWMKAFLQDPDVDVAELPPEIAEEFGKRLDEVKTSEPEPKAKTDPWSKQSQPKDVKDPNPKAAGYPGRSPRTDPWSQQPAVPAPTVGGMTPLVATSMSLVVQRCVSAKISSDDQSKRTAAIGPGLLCTVSMAEGATEEGVVSAAKFILTSKLSGRTGWFPAARGIDRFGSGAESVVSLCKRGEHQGIMVIPQLSLVSDISNEGLNLGYSRTTKSHKRMAEMYDLFVQSLHASAPELVEQAVPAADEDPSDRKGLGGFFAGLGDAVGMGQRKPTLPEIVAGEFGGAHYMEVKSAGPFMHSFAF
jgi:D-Tyr-tRNAtyr deacylase